MRLSRLHITGFKSFPDRAELGFDTGVTAIVGPNGCGKSNVVDAITWVLGEQSAKSLRGDRMEDVIFNGSDARKPTAAAEVRLRLADVTRVAPSGLTAPDAGADLLGDGVPLVKRDVEIGRRLYRSGESEYLIDGEVCRLRDVHDLLMDSGLGVKAYAVIEQGKIGQILSSRPAERRVLIEEAAGVTKYKARRRAAELKLEAAQQNLTRVDDIIFEVEKQRAGLRRQAARARRYRRLREELRRWEQVHLAHRHAMLAREIEDADARLAAARAREAAAAAHLSALETTLERLRLALTEAERTATDARERGHARELEYGRRQQQIAFNRQQLEALAEQREAFTAEVAELEARLSPAVAAAAGQREAAAHARAALEAAAARAAQCESEYARAQTAVQAEEQDSDATRAAVLAAGGTLAALRQARDHAAAARDRVAAELDRLDLETRELDAEAARYAEGRAEAARRLEAARALLSTAVSARSEAEQHLANVRADRDRTARTLADRRQDLAAGEARLRSLEELEAARASFGDAARLLLSQSGRLPACEGAVADHLIVDRPYERAVDALFGNLLQHVVLRRAVDLPGAIAALAAQDAGRCGFVILEDLAARPPRGPVVVPPGAKSLADVVRATGPFAAAIDRLIGRALIVDDFESARRMARETDLPVATVTGEVCRRGGLVEAGSRSTTRGILETRAEVATLREHVAAAAADVTRLALDEARLAAAVAAAETTLSECLARQHDREKDLVGLDADMRRVTEEHERVTRRLELVRADRQRAADEERLAEARRAEAAAAIAAEESRQHDAEVRLGDVGARLAAAREVAEAMRRTMADARAEQAALAERVAAMDTDASRLDEVARDLESRIAQRRQDLVRIDRRRHELSDESAATERQLDADVTAIEALRESVRAADGRVTELRGEFVAGEHEIRGARHQLEDVRKDVTQAEVARATASAELAHLDTLCLETVGAPLDAVLAAVARMEESGELDAPASRLAAAGAIEEAEIEIDEDRPPAAAEGASPDSLASAADPGAPATPPGPLTPEDAIADLKRKIERLGPVNMMAIEQFDELENRHAFLTGQRKDLLDSIALTGEAIRKIDRTTRERFADAFQAINRHFESTFTTLFGGGRAGLHLIDQDNDEESGIEIIAQPPGKRLQNVQLLSGGEKALTAMALMFAIFKYRPSPFCLLDEIDAPLDDANIGRFVEMLQGMQAHTQFILITHNRKTMEIADRLYGVTMEEPGVSKLISVDLRAGG